METENRSVLFVDDDEQIIALLRRLFVNEKPRTFFAQSGEEGLEILDENRIDLVVSDMQMPQMDGIAFLEKVKEKYPETIRYMMSGSADKCISDDSLLAEYAHRVLLKPWDNKRLREIIRKALQ